MLQGFGYEIEMLKTLNKYLNLKAIFLLYICFVLENIN